MGGLLGHARNFFRGLTPPPLARPQRFSVACPEGHRLSGKEALLLFRTRGRQVWEIATAADEVREERAGNAVTYVRNQNINVTNLCVNACGFCGFSKKPGDEGIYFHDETMIRRKAKEAYKRGVSEICTVSGLHPDFTAQSYTDVYRWIRESAPGVHLHAGNPMEVAYAAKKSRTTSAHVLDMMREAGLGSMCGTAAEILVDSVRAKICRQKIPTKEWVRIITEAHGLGIPTTATMRAAAARARARSSRRSMLRSSARRGLETSLRRPRPKSRSSFLKGSARALFPVPSSHAFVPPTSRASSGSAFLALGEA